MRNDVKHKIASLLRRAALALALATGCGLASAGVVHVTIDTASFGAASGFLDMNLGVSGAVPLATATVTNLVGFQGSPYIDSWGVTAVAGGWRFRNDASNDLFQSVDFGGVLSFDLTFAGAVDPMTNYISKFVVSAFGSDGFTPLGHYDPMTGALAEFAWTPGLTAGADGHVFANLSDPHVRAVPEPGPWLLIGIGCAALALTRRRVV
ncbi:NF038129 family PEP-CTERM protein [Pseudoduganella namucuonensis]|uniref:PEP-CTERM protein-sorting domain-containing protein n=1 Tax=Pseudoduganella namucuonensis TaxID=1035707 RepID=A0A1I7M6G6_9BURK|nr:NF038129 family PEP-CTERM protein [Pseudoduganella namucuonensis]SFV17541.1 PEP-CTERM protein-sorting domain-containing protein [Pseudoduganella namucuonensis]